MLLNCHNDTFSCDLWLHFAAFHAVYGSMITAEASTLKKLKTYIFNVYHRLKIVSKSAMSFGGWHGDHNTEVIQFQSR